MAESGGEIVYANSACERLTGFARGELLGRTVHELLADDLAEHPAGTSFDTCSPARADGGELPVEVHIGRIEAESPLLVVTLRDRTEVEAGRAARFEAEAKYRALVEHIPVVYLDPVDENLESIYVSPRSWSSWASSRRVAQRPLCVATSRPPRGHRPCLGRVPPRVQRARAAEPRVPDGSRGRQRSLGPGAGVPDRRRAGPALVIQGVIFDITERKLAEEQVAFLAYHDKLTGLPNRALFEEMLEAAICARAAMTSAWECSTSTSTTSSS